MKANKQNKNEKEVSIVYGDDNSINVNIFNNKILMEVVGSFDNNIKELEKVSGSKIYFRGNSIAIKGDKHANEKVKDAIEYLIDRFKSDKQIDKNYVKEIIENIDDHFGIVILANNWSLAAVDCARTIPIFWKKQKILLFFRHRLEKLQVYIKVK